MGEFIFADQYILESNQTRRFYQAFLKGLVHKSNNMVGVIQGFGSLTLMEDGLTGSVRESVEQMETSGRQMSELNKKVLGASGCSAVESASSDLTAMFPFFEQKANDFGKANNMSVQFQAEPGIVSAQVDNVRFSEVFEELIKNAMESTGAKGGEVKIEFSNPGSVTSSGEIDLFIHNPCKGFANEKIHEFYEPFYTSKGNDHFGLGLTTAAVLCGEMSIRLGMKIKDETLTTWLSIPVPE